MKYNQHEQLFTELVPAEAAVVEGGLSLIINRIQALWAGADLIGADDTYIKVNGRKIWGNYSIALPPLHHPVSTNLLYASPPL